MAPAGELVALRAHVAQLREDLTAAQAELERDRREHRVSDVIEPQDLVEARREVAGLAPAAGACGWRWCAPGSARRPARCRSRTTCECSR